MNSLSSKFNRFRAALTFGVIYVIFCISVSGVFADSSTIFLDTRKNALAVTNVTTRNQLLLKIAHLQVLSKDLAGATETAQLVESAEAVPLEDRIRTLAEAQAALANLSASSPQERVRFLVHTAESAHWRGIDSRTLSQMFALAAREATRESDPVERLVILGEIAAPNFSEADFHVVPAARKILGLPDKEAKAGEAAQRIQEVIGDSKWHHPRVFQALVRLVRSEARRARWYRPLRRFALEVPISDEHYDFASALQMVREAEFDSGNTIEGKAEGISRREARRTPEKPDWRLRFSRQLQVAALASGQIESKAMEQSEILAEVNKIWRPRWQQASPPPDKDIPCLVARYEPQGSLALLRREINALVMPPAYVLNSSQRDVFLAHQSSNVEAAFEQFIAELPFMMSYYSEMQDYHPDRAPLIYSEAGPVGKLFYDDVEKELKRLPDALQAKLLPAFLVAKYASVSFDQREMFLKGGVLRRLPSSQMSLVLRFIYLTSQRSYAVDTSVLQSLLPGHSPEEQARMQIAFLRGAYFGGAEPDYVNSQNYGSIKAAQTISASSGHNKFLWWKRPRKTSHQNARCALSTLGTNDLDSGPCKRV